MNGGPLAGLGVGIGWRPEIAEVVGELPRLRFCEVVAESVHARLDRSLPLDRIAYQHVAGGTTDPDGRATCGAERDRARRRSRTDRTNVTEKSR